MNARVVFAAAAAAAAAAELPPPRPAAAPVLVEPPTAEMVRRLHEIVGPQHQNKKMSEEEMAASFQRFLDARGGRIEPLWANHSHAERTANLQFHHAKRQSARRRAQSERRRTQLGVSLFQGDSEETKRTNTITALEPASSTCDDPLATNVGTASPCTYDCADLQQEYFPEPQSQTTRCFLFDPGHRDLAGGGRAGRRAAEPAGAALRDPHVHQPRGRHEPFGGRSLLHDG